MAATSTTGTHPYGIKNYKEFRGHDGFGYSAQITLDGKSIGYVVDDGWGGPLQYQEMSREDENALATYATAQPPVEYEGHELTTSLDLFVGTLVEAAQAELDAKKFVASLKRAAKTKTLFVKDGESIPTLDTGGSYSFFKGVTADQIVKGGITMREYVHAKYVGSKVYDPSTGEWN